MREYHKLISWLVFGLLIFAAPDSTAQTQKGTETKKLGEEYKGRKEVFETKILFHNLLFQRHFLSLPFHGYLIGIEGAGDPFVSHIGKFHRPQKNRVFGWSTCFLYNAYFAGDSKCDNLDNSGGERNAKDIGFMPINRLSKEINDVINKSKGRNERITHILVFSTGYNTTQWESLANYHDLYLNLNNASQPFWHPLCENRIVKLFIQCRDFNPLFIGISWRSFSAVWERSAALITDFPWATTRADKIGKALAITLLKKVLLPLKREHGIPIILIGHSLGAKILSQAAYSVTSDDDEPLPPIDLLVGLQGAFTMGRYAPEHFYHRNKRRVKTAIFTTSEHDKILNKLNGIFYEETKNPLKKMVYFVTKPLTAFMRKTLYLTIGSELARDTAKNYPDLYSLAMADADGKLEKLDKCGDGKPVLVNADHLINRDPLGGPGGAHSDVYRKEMGTFLWNVIQKCVFDGLSRMK